MKYNLEYPKSSTNTIKRYKAHGVYDLETVHSIVNSCQILHISFTTPSEPFPVVLPMIGTLASFERPSAGLGEPLDLYLHGYVSSRMMNLAQGEGMPVCVAASHVDGLVLTLATFSHNYNYRSAILYGYATVVKTDEEKVYAMEQITNSVVPDRWRHTRLPPLASEMQSTNILRVKITSASAKTSAGQAHDEEVDMANEEVRDRVWTGVVPVRQMAGEPVGSAYNRVEVPEHVREFVRGFNEEGGRVMGEASMGERR